MSPRVRLVDDEANIRRMGRALLQSDGFETVEAAGGTAALQRLLDDAPDVVLLDLMMPPGPDGLATLEQIRKRAPHIPVVMMSGKATLADAVRATKLGASAIHRLSARGNKPFVTVNSAALPRDLVESEMFGHERGAFTGATERRQGRFELADGGTLFLDEVGDLSTEAQAKLLRVLETGVVERLGGERPLTVDVRVLAATNKDLVHAVQHGQFREDLWFRLNVLPVAIPPLRERPEDVPPLVRHFAARCAARLGRPVRFDAGALQLLGVYRWPGNVRELANIVERLPILATGDTIVA